MEYYFERMFKVSTSRTLLSLTLLKSETRVNDFI